MKDRRIDRGGGGGELGKNGKIEIDRTSQIELLRRND